MRETAGPKRTRESLWNQLRASRWGDATRTAQSTISLFDIGRGQTTPSSSSHPHAACPAWTTGKAWGVGCCTSTCCSRLLGWVKQNTLACGCRSTFFASERHPFTKASRRALRIALLLSRLDFKRTSRRVAQARRRTRRTTIIHESIVCVLAKAWDG